MLNYLKSFIVGEEPPKEGTKILISGSMDDGQDENDLEDQEEEVSPTKDQELEETKEPIASPPKEQPYHFEEYRVGVDDTLYGIALTYDINPAVLKRDNGLELDEVYSGQTLKVRVRDELPPEPEEHLLPRANTAPTDLHSKENFRLSVKNRSRTVSHDLTQLEKWGVYYCTSIGDIEGVLSFESTKLVFVPVGLTKTSLKSKASGDTEPSASSKEDYQNKYLSQWGAEIQVDDIAECHIMTVPGIACEEHFGKYGEYQKDYLLQIILYGHGHRSMGKYLNDLFSHMKGSKVPYACVYFKFKTDIDEERQFTNKQKQIMSHQVQNRITSIKEAIKEGGTETTDSTELPYFEFLFERFEKQDADLLRKISRKESVSRPILSDLEKEKILAEINSEEETKFEELPTMVTRRSGKRMMIPKIADESQILNLEQFTELINCVPELYQTLQWKLTYSTAVHGTSFQNLLRRTQCESPNLIVIQDENNFVFGVYTSDEIWYSDIYYGSGETFLFTFRDLNEISSFYWSKKNNLFSFVSEEGIMFGAGPHYGLWMNNELTRGRSFECETFNNPMLSYKTDFEIIKLEVWSIIDPFTSEHVPKENIVSFVDKEQ